MLSGHLVGGGGGQECQGAERARFGVIREGRIDLSCGLFPPADAEPIIGRRRFEEERLRRSHEEPFPLGRRLKGLGLLHRIPPPLERFGSRPRGPERLKQRHRDAPMRHRAPRVCRRHSLECFPCLWIRHVMQEGDRAIELHLGLLGAGDGKVNRAKGVAGVLLGLAFCVTCAAPQQHDHQTGSDVPEDRTTNALHEPPHLPPRRRMSAMHSAISVSSTGTLMSDRRLMYRQPLPALCFPSWPRSLPRSFVPSIR